MQEYWTWKAVPKTAIGLMSKTELTKVLGTKFWELPIRAVVSCMRGWKLNKTNLYNFFDLFPTVNADSKKVIDLLKSVSNKTLGRTILKSINPQLKQLSTQPLKFTL